MNDVGALKSIVSVKLGSDVMIIEIQIAIFYEDRTESISRILEQVRLHSDTMSP